jgi:hypothetical protein
MRKRLATAKGKGRAGDNSGPTALAAALQGAFENNSSSTVSVQTSGAKRRKGVQREARPVEPVEVVDDEDEREGKARNQGSITLAHALTNAFTHNSADPNVAGPSASGPSGSTRRRRRISPVAIDSDTSSVELHPSTPVKRPRAQRRARADSDYNVPSSPGVATRRRNEKRQPQTPTSPQRKRRRLTRRRDDADEHEAQEDGEIEIVDSPPLEPRRSLRTKPHSNKSTPKHDPSRPNVGRSRQQRRAVMLSPVSISASTSSHSPSPPPPHLAPPQSPPPSSPDVNTLPDQPLMILPPPAHADIVISARALNHLHASPRPPDLESLPRAGGDGTETSETETRPETLQGFHGEEAAVGAHGLLESSTTVAATTGATDTMGATKDSSAYATATNLQNHSLDLGMDVIVPMAIDDRGQELVQERQDVVRAMVVPPHALRISSSTHPEGPMLSFVLSEREDADAVRASLSVSADPDTEASSGGVGLELDANTGPESEFILDSLDSGFNAGAGWTDWSVSGPGPSTGVVAEGEYAGDGTIDPSVLGGCGVIASPGKVLGSDTVASDENSSPLRGSVSTRTIDKNKSLDDVGEEGDIVRSLFKDRIFPPSSVGGTGIEDRDKVVASARRLVANGKRMRKKSWRKALADENQPHKDTNTENADTEDNQSIDGSRPTLSSLSSLLNAEPTFCHHCRCKNCRPKMRCTLIRERTGMPCGKMYCDHCIEKR